MDVVTGQTQLDDLLALDDTGGISRIRRKDNYETLIGQPRVKLDNDDLVRYLRESHLTQDLDKLTRYIQLLGLATPSHAHISALHHQAARGRDITVVMNPNLHLVWYYDRIFITPIPRYMLSEAFWKFLHREDKALWQACAGFMRTYWYLIKYEIDFQKASDDNLRLIPVVDKQDPITFERLVEFLEPFSRLDDEQVSKRFAFGELRLSRLNMLTRFFLGKMTYHHIHAQWKEYLGRFLAPFIALFVLISTVLSAMQVALGTGLDTTGTWQIFFGVSRWFSVITIILVLVTFFLYLILVTVMTIHDFFFAKKIERRKRTPEHDHAKVKSGVV